MARDPLLSWGIGPGKGNGGGRGEIRSIYVVRISARRTEEALDFIHTT